MQPIFNKTSLPERKSIKKYKQTKRTSFLLSITFDERLFHSPLSHSTAIVHSSDLVETLPLKNI